MIKLYTDDDFNIAKSNSILELECENCHIKMLKEKRVILYGLKGYNNRQNDLCKDCFYKKKTILLKDNCYLCKKSFEYKKSSKKKSNIKLCSIDCRNKYLKECVKNKRNEINEKISKKLKLNHEIKIIENGINLKIIKCKYCQIEFSSLNRKGKYCSDECKSLLRKKIFQSDEHRKKMSKCLKGKAGGIRDGGGYSKVYEYVNIHNEKMKLNKSEIEIAKVLDYLKLNWNRNKFGFPYKDMTGNSRNYYPDFYVKDYDVYVEYKGFVTDKMIHKMNDAVEKNNFYLLIIYSNNKRYKNIGLNDDQIKNDKNSIIDAILNLKK